MENKFGIHPIYLGGADRRVLASTVESLLSKNETLVLTTACFFRDVLLEDYPPEVFIQESSLSMAMLEVAESSWNDVRVPETASQGLMRLSYLLRVRISQINDSDFFEIGKKTLSPNQYSGMSSSYSSHNDSTSPSSDAFIETICKLLKGISRTLLFHPTNFKLWQLMDSFSFTICKCARTIPLNYKALSIGIQDVLLDVSYGYEKNGREINSAILALCIASLLKALQIRPELFVLAYDIRQCIRRLSRCQSLKDGWPELLDTLTSASSPFLNNSSSFEIGDGDYSASARRKDELSSMPETKEAIVEIPNEAISKHLIAVQNATSHLGVFQAIDNLWLHILPWNATLRQKGKHLDSVCENGLWRDSFYRFLCVEPTCAEDEDLLVKVLDLINHLVGITGSTKLMEWIVPLCMEDDCALLKVLNSHCLKMDCPYSGTILPNIIRSLFDFFLVLWRKWDGQSQTEYKWNVFYNYCAILHKLGERNFPYPAILCPILKGISLYSSSDDIRAQFGSNYKFCIALIHRINDLMISLQEKSGGISGESYRNQGVVYYASLSLYHVIAVISKDEAVLNSDWIGTCCAVVPCMCESQDTKVKAMGYQISEVLSRTVQGAIALMTILQSPSTIWRSCYNTLMNKDESSITKAHCAQTLCNLLASWEKVNDSTQIGRNLHLPSWTVLDDIAKLFDNVYWQPSLSRVCINAEESLPNDEDFFHSQIVTPKVLAAVCKLIIRIVRTRIPELHPEPFVAEVSSSGLCPVLFRLVGSHSLTTDLDPVCWTDSCYAFSSLTEALIELCQLDRSISLMLIGDKRGMSHLIKFLAFQPIPDQNNNQEILLSTLWINVFILLSILCTDSKNNFEDFERCVISQIHIIFTRLEHWLKPDAMAKCRKAALTFAHEFLSKLMQKDFGNTNEHTASTQHKILCLKWKNVSGKTYGSGLYECLKTIYEESTVFDQKQNVLKTITALVVLSPSAKSFAIKEGAVDMLIKKLREYGIQYYDTEILLASRKNSHNNRMDETIAILSLLSSLVCKNEDGKKSALFCRLPDACHKIFKWWKVYPDRTLLHTYIETFMNFTEEFPLGCQSLTLTTSVIGVGPRKAPAPQCFLIEFIDILQIELDAAESCNLRTMELLFELLKNATFVMECRTILIKSTILLYLPTLNVRDLKKWGPKQHRVKELYLDFLISVSIHPDMQMAIAKIPEALDTIVLLIDHGDALSSNLALKLIRNLAFQPANRTRLLCDDIVIPSLSAKIRDGQDSEDIECAAVAIWALIANSEKGKLAARRSLCLASVAKAMSRFKKLEQSSNDILSTKQDVTNLTTVLKILSSLLGDITKQSVQSDMILKPHNTIFK